MYYITNISITDERMILLKSSKIYSLVYSQQSAFRKMTISCHQGSIFTAFLSQALLTTHSIKAHLTICCANHTG